MQKDVKRIVFALFLAAIIMLSSCSGTTDIKSEYNTNWKLDILQDSLVDGCYTRFLLASGNKKIYFDGLCEVDKREDYTLAVVDLTGDSIPEIAVIFTVAHGTGCLIQEAHIFDGVTFDRYEVRDAVDLAYGHLSLSADDAAYYITGESETFVIDKAEIISKADYGAKLFPLPFFEFICEYKIQDGHLYAYLPIQAGMTEFCGGIEILYKLNSNFFDCESITVNMETEKQLLASIPELDVYIYAYAIKGETSFIESSPKTMIGAVDIYLETKNENPVWLYKRALARSEFGLYSGMFFFNEQNYLILVDYEHGGYGGGDERFMVFDENYSIVPIREKYRTPYNCLSLDDNDVFITLFDSWTFEIPLGELKESYNTGNIFGIEDNHLVDYYYVHPSELYDGKKTNGQITLCFKISYILENGEICIGTVDFVENEKYYRVH